MAARGIPRNPNSPPPVPQSGLEAHWVRTLILALLLACVFALLHGPAQLKLPASALPQAGSATLMPQIAPAPASSQAGAPPIPTAAPVPPAGLSQAQANALIAAANQAFRVARAQADAAALAGVATGSWLAQEQAYIAGLRQSGQAERWTLLSLNVTAVAMAAAGATICTTERWQVAPRGADASAVQLGEFTERYSLVQNGDQWLIEQISYLDGPCQA